MASDFDIEVKLPTFGRMTESVRQELRGEAIRLTQRLAALVRRKLSGEVLHIRTGKLIGSISSELIETTDSVGGRVGTSGVPYARIHEFGGQTSPHEIVARNSKSLAFVWGGKQVFFKRVNHPGSKIPERSYLRSSLEDMRAEITAAYQRAGAAGAQKELRR